MRTAILFGLLAAAASPAALFAQEAPPACDAAPAPLPPELAGWTAPVALAGATNAAQARHAMLVPGVAVAATLHRTAEIDYARRPEQPGGSVSYGGMFGLAVATAGTYRLALGSGAWIDVLGRGEPVASSAHGRGPACSGIRKMVDFPLAPGRYLVQIAANGAPRLSLMVVLLP